MSAPNGLTIRWLTLSLGLLVAFGSVFAYVQSTYVPRDEYQMQMDQQQKMLEEIRRDVKDLLRQRRLVQPYGRRDGPPNAAG